MSLQRYNRGMEPDEASLNLLAELGANPVFAMSLGSKELFHSNFLGWLLEHRRDIFLPKLLDAAEIRATPDKDDGSDNRAKVSREHNSFDLTVEINKDEILIIENKFKSLPRSRQLAEYARKAQKAYKVKTAHLVLLSPSPLPRGTSTEWKYLSYEKLLVILRGVIDSEKDPF